MGETVAAVEVEAFNTAHASENRIHDDATAKRYGFAGGLVPGVDVYAYMTQPVVRHWGRAWLERGTIAVRLRRPVYDGERVLATARASGEGLDLACTARGGIAADGRADLPRAPAAPVGPEEIPRRPLPAERPPASADSLAAGTVLGSPSRVFAAADAPRLLADLRETSHLYVDGGLVPPGLLLRLANDALKENVRLGPWMHVESEVANFSPVAWGETVGARAVVTRNYGHKGHRFVDLDVLVSAGDRVAARVRHVAIWEPRVRTAG